MSKYGVFIIESLGSEDHAEGDNLFDVLKQSKINAIYKWADSEEEFISHLKEFKKSGFRYLHISCHADKFGIHLNNFSISNVELETLFSGSLKKKRVFLSACQGANTDLAFRLIIKNDAMSLIGTPIGLPFDKSAIFWPCFYHVINELDHKKMNRANIKSVLQRCVDLLHVPINYYDRSTKNPQSIWIRKIRSKRKIIAKKINH